MMIDYFESISTKQVEKIYKYARSEMLKRGKLGKKKSSNSALQDQVKKFRNLRKRNPRGRIHEEERSIILKLSNQGLNPNQISKELGRKRDSIKRILNQSSN